MPRLLGGNTVVSPPLTKIRADVMLINICAFENRFLTVGVQWEGAHSKVLHLEQQLFTCHPTPTIQFV
jgi:hypothetical protein